MGPGTSNWAGTLNLNDVHNKISNILPQCCHDKGLSIQNMLWIDRGKESSDDSRDIMIEK